MDDSEINSSMQGALVCYIRLEGPGWFAAVLVENVASFNTYFTMYFSFSLKRWQEPTSALQQDIAGIQVSDDVGLTHSTGHLIFVYPGKGCCFA